MNDDLIPFRGRLVTPDWPAQLEAAQTDAEFETHGKVYLRVKYGSEEEDWGADRGPCHDCAAIKGEFHVPGCDVERCPACGGQAIGCDCDGEDDEDGSLDDETV